MPEKVKVGIIGLGSLSQRGTLPHTAQDDAREKIEAVAVCDPVPGRAEAVAEKWNWREAYADHKEMLAKAGIDAVVINSPIPYHFNQIKDSLDAGKHVYSQKSMTTTFAEADAVVELAKSKNLVLVASPGEMLRPPWIEIKQQVLEAGLLGQVYWALAGMQFPGHEYEQFRKEGDVLSNVDPTWYYKKGGGPVYDMTVYNLHQLTGLLGPVKAVSAMSDVGLPFREWRGEKVEVEMDDNTQMLLDFGDGRHAVAFGAFCYGGALPRMAIFGSAGMLEVTNFSPGRGSEVIVRGGKIDGGEKTIEQGEMPYRVGPHKEIGEPHGYADIMHFVDCIRTGQKPIPSGEHARHVIEIIEGAYQASREKRTIEITSSF